MFGKKLLKRSAVAILLTAGLIMTSFAAQAGTTVIDPGEGTYTFTGMSTLTAGIFSANCKLGITGTVVTDGSGNVTITVTTGSVKPGDSLCENIDLVFDPAWTATIPQSKLPPESNKSQVVNDAFSNVIVKYTVLGFPNTCGPGLVDVSFTNGAPPSQPSSFLFDDSFDGCSVNGTLSYDDVNVYVIP